MVTNITKDMHFSRAAKQKNKKLEQFIKQTNHSGLIIVYGVGNFQI